VRAKNASTWGAVALPFQTQGQVSAGYFPRQPQTYREKPPRRANKTASVTALSWQAV
jgi:hypothetical protein